MNESKGKYHHNNALAQQADVRAFTTSSLYGHFCKIHRILSVSVQILYVISLFGGFGMWERQPSLLGI